MDIDKKLGDMSERELIVFVIGETRHISRKLDNHIDYHAKQDERHWKLFLGLLLTSITVISGVLIAVLC